MPRCVHTHLRDICCNTFPRKQYSPPEVIQYPSRRWLTWTFQDISAYFSGEASWINSSCIEENIYFLALLLGVSGVWGVAGCFHAKYSWIRCVFLSWHGTTSHPREPPLLPCLRQAVPPLWLTTFQRSNATGLQPESFHEYEYLYTMIVWYCSIIFSPCYWGRWNTAKVCTYI